MTHSNVGLTETFTEIQNELFSKIMLVNKFNKKDIKLVAGVDLAYWEEHKITYGTCCIVILDYATKKIVEKVYSYGEISVPYIPGFLAFRELPLILEAVKKIKNIPDLYMFDGNGYLHYRHMGIATHASIFLKRPTIGVAKSYLKIQGVDFLQPENQSGSYTDIVINNEVYGRALRTSKNIKPIFVSSGNWIDLNTSTEIVMDFINKESRLPIPVRQADIETHKVRKQLAKK